MKKRILVITAVMTLSTAFLAGCGSARQQTAANTEITAEAAANETTAEIVTNETIKEAVTNETTAETEATYSKPVETEATDIESTAVSEIETVKPSAETPAFTFSDLKRTRYATTSLNVRNLPSIEGEKVGGLSTNQKVKITGQCNETSWYRIEYNGNIAYVSNDYIAPYRSVSSIDELTLYSYDEDFVAIIRNVEKVWYTFNDMTVLLYDYRAIDDDASDTQIVLAYTDGSGEGMPWWRINARPLHALKDTSDGFIYYQNNIKKFQSISSFLVDK